VTVPHAVSHGIRYKFTAVDVHSGPRVLSISQALSRTYAERWQDFTPADQETVYCYLSLVAKVTDDAVERADRLLAFMREHDARVFDLGTHRLYRDHAPLELPPPDPAQTDFFPDPGRRLHGSRT
jgi:hypothetical protein